MLKVEMPESRAGGLVVPGGWTAKIPEITLEPKALNAYVSYVMRRKSAPMAEAAEIVRLAHQDRYNYGYISSLRAAVRYRAEQYLKRYGSLDGFDPELMMRLWMPGENVGRRGKPFALTLMAEMAKNVGQEDL